MSAEFEVVLAGVLVVIYASKSKHCPSNSIRAIVDRFGFAIMLAGILFLLYKCKLF